MRGRTMYVDPLQHGPDRLARSRISACRLPIRPTSWSNMRIMTRMGDAVLKALGRTASSSPVCTRSACRSSRAKQDVPWPCSPDPKDKYIVHFPEERMIWSYGSGYGGNALLGKKCLALRIASLHGPRRRLARRAHADHRRQSAGRREDLRRRRLPQRLRQDQLRHAHPAQGIPRAKAGR